MPVPKPYDDNGQYGAEIEKTDDYDTDRSDMDYPDTRSEYESMSGEETDTDDQVSVQSEPPQYKNLESNLEEEHDFAEINF